VLFALNIPRQKMSLISIAKFVPKRSDLWS
jgi:hypothetical protein